MARFIMQDGKRVMVSATNVDVPAPTVEKKQTKAKAGDKKEVKTK